MPRKLYTAFVSSVYTSLKDERKTVIDALVKRGIYPICMENFTVTSNGQFGDIEKMIDDSDIFVLLLGDKYGSVDENGISWTEREYLYATKKGKPVIAFEFEKLTLLKTKSAKRSVNSDEQKQIDFASRVGFTKKVTKKDNLKSVIDAAFDADCIDVTKLAGWERVDLGMNADELAKWKEDNKHFNVSGTWYHVHLNNKDPEYIRIGTIEINQNFDPDEYLDLHIYGENYGVAYYDGSEMVRKYEQYSSFDGKYYIKPESSEIFGIYFSKRMFRDSFGNVDVDEGIRRGIHEFKIDKKALPSKPMRGEFHDEAPSPKHGAIYLFREKRERDDFLLQNRKQYIKTEI